MRRYLFKNKGLLFSSSLLGIVNSTLGVGLAFIFKYVIDQVMSEMIYINSIINIILSLSLYIFSIFIVGILYCVVRELYIKRTMIEIKKDVFYNIIAKDITDFSRVNSGRYISILSNDMTMIEKDYLKNIFNIINTMWGFFLATISMFWLSKEITLFVIGLGVLMMFLPKLFGKTLSDKKANYSNSLEIFTFKIKDVFLGFDIIKTFNSEEKIKKEYDVWNKKTQGEDYKFNVYQAVINVIGTIVSLSIFGVVFIVGSYFVINGRMDIGTMLACVQLCNNVANPIGDSIEIINNIKSLKSISDKIMIVMKSEKENRVYREKKEFNREITLENVKFSYDNNKSVINNISLKFEKGKKYAIVGASGCGKSTLLKLILKYFNNYDGDIKVDDLDLKDISKEKIYELITMIHQNVFIFDATLKENLTLFGDYDNEDINKAIKLSGLEVVLKNLELGVESSLGESGNLLSGGEKQRIAIARALIKKTPILFLDEATSSLDNETSYKIEKTILKMKDVTAVVITHKLLEDVLKDYDEIIVLKNGKVIEQGSFYELIDKKEYFYSFYNIAT
ncbi:MAG: ABC transporter ATP-binding protein [Clostridium sp.]